MDKIYKLGDFAKRISVNPKTLIYWDNNNILKANRTKTKRRYYTEYQALDWLGITESNINKNTIAYCRVSTKNQKDDLKNQIEYIKNYAVINGISLDSIYEDYGSALNYNRKYFNEILTLVEEGKISKIIITHKDRLVRFGFEWFDSFCNKHGVDILILNNTTKDIHSELVEDMLSIIHVFSCKLYGLRNYKRKTKLEKVVEDAINKKN